MPTAAPHWPPRASGDPCLRLPWAGQTNLVKIGDFGIAKVLANTGQMANTAIGTPYYLSPEICQVRLPHARGVPRGAPTLHLTRLPAGAQDKKYDNKSDIWSLGCVLYELCALRHPFQGRNIRELVGRIMKGAYRPIPAIYRCDAAAASSPVRAYRSREGTVVAVPPRSRELGGLVNRMLRLDPRCGVDEGGSSHTHSHTHSSTLSQTAAQCEHAARPPHRAHPHRGVPDPVRAPSGVLPHRAARAPGAGGRARRPPGPRAARRGWGGGG